MRAYRAFAGMAFLAAALSSALASTPAAARPGASHACALLSRLDVGEAVGVPVRDGLPRWGSGSLTSCWFATGRDGEVRILLRRVPRGLAVRRSRQNEPGVSGSGATARWLESGTGPTCTICGAQAPCCASLAPDTICRFRSFGPRKTPEHQRSYGSWPPSRSGVCRSALPPPLHFAVHDRRHRTAAERPSVERRISAARGGLIHVVRPLDVRC